MIRRRSRRGLSLIEFMISVAIFSTIGLFVSFVSLALGRQAKDSLTQIPAQEQAYRTADFIRNRLLPTQQGTIIISTDANTIEFRNPSNPQRSRLTFDAQKKQLVYDPNILVSGDESIWGRNVTGRFQVGTTPRKIVVQVNTTALDRRRGDLTFRIQEEITLRN